MFQFDLKTDIPAYTLDFLEHVLDLVVI